MIRDELGRIVWDISIRCALDAEQKRWGYTLKDYGITQEDMTWDTLEEDDKEVYIQIAEQVQQRLLWDQFEQDGVLKLAEALARSGVRDIIREVAREELGLASERLQTQVARLIMMAPQTGVSDGL